MNPSSPAAQSSMCGRLPRRHELGALSAVFTVHFTTGLWICPAVRLAAELYRGSALLNTAETSASDGSGAGVRDVGLAVLVAAAGIVGSWVGDMIRRCCMYGPAKGVSVLRTSTVFSCLACALCALVLGTARGGGGPSAGNDGGEGGGDTTTARGVSSGSMLGLFVSAAFLAGVSNPLGLAALFCSVREEDRRQQQPHRAPSVSLASTAIAHVRGGHIKRTRADDARLVSARQIETLQQTRRRYSPSSTVSGDAQERASLRVMWLSACTGWLLAAASTVQVARGREEATAELSHYCAAAFFVWAAARLLQSTMSDSLFFAVIVPWAFPSAAQNNILVVGGEEGVVAADDVVVDGGRRGAGAGAGDLGRIREAEPRARGYGSGGGGEGDVLMLSHGQVEAQSRRYASLFLLCVCAQIATDTASAALSDSFFFRTQKWETAADIIIRALLVGVGTLALARATSALSPPSQASVGVSSGGGGGTGAVSIRRFTIPVFVPSTQFAVFGALVVALVSETLLATRIPPVIGLALPMVAASAAIAIICMRCVCVLLCDGVASARRAVVGGGSGGGESASDSGSNGRVSSRVLAFMRAPESVAEFFVYAMSTVFAGRLCGTLVWTGCVRLFGAYPLPAILPILLLVSALAPYAIE